IQRVIVTYVSFYLLLATSTHYTLSLHDALPICGVGQVLVQNLGHACADDVEQATCSPGADGYAVLSLSRRCEHRKRQSSPRYQLDRKSTRLNSSHVKISYAVFCLKKKIDVDDFV